MEFLTSSEIMSKIKEIISGAEKDIKIASAWIKGKIFEEILDIAGRKKIPVEIVLRASELQDLLITDEKVFQKISEVNGKVYLCSRLHAKFIVVDDSKAVVGSANFTDAGLSDISTGNIEASVYYDSEDNPEQVKSLVDYFHKIKEDHSVEFGGDLIGFTLNPVKTQTFEFVLIDDNVDVQSYVEVRLPESKVIGRITSIYSYDMGFFANPFTSYESPVFAPFEDFRTIFASNKYNDWKKAAVYAYINSNGKRLKVATADITGILKDGKLDVLTRPFNVGEAVYRISEETLREILTKNFSGKEMEIPIKAGVLLRSNIDVFIDGREIISKHMLIIGTTGSGKSYFAKRLVCNFLGKHPNFQIFIFDPHGEYYNEIKNCIGETEIEHIKVEDTIFPVYPEEVEELIKEAGYANLISGNSLVARSNKSRLSRAIKPSLELTELSERNLVDIIGELQEEDNQKNRKVKKVIIEEIINYLKNAYGDAVENQCEILGQIKSGINSEKKVVIFDFKEVIDPQTRVNIAGLAMQEIFYQNKLNPQDRLVILEEAHNFAPERGYGDVSAGKENLALTIAKKIAAEGRKFNLGMIVITQRPAQVSKYVLSQLNTQAMFRTINASDLDAISTYIEYAGEDIIRILPSLPTGTGVLSGIGVPFTVVAEIK